MMLVDGFIMLIDKPRRYRIIITFLSRHVNVGIGGLGIISSYRASNYGAKQYFKENVTSIMDLILAQGVPANEFKSLLQSLHNFGNLLWTSNRLEEATWLLDLIVGAAWNCVLHSCKMFISRKSSYREVDVDDFVKEASALSVTMLKLRGQCPTKIQNSLEFSIGRWFEAYSLYYKISRPVDLVQTWVKILREVHDSTAEVGLTPYSLMAYLKQQTTYKNCDPRLSKIIEQIISNIILEEICTKSHGPLHTAWDLIANGRELRARGIENLNDCNASLSQAITTLIANKDKVDGGPNCLVLAEAYGLLALCKHERKPTKEDYLQDIEKAADLWSSQKHDQFVKETQIVSHNSFNLLYQFNDLLNLKDYKKDLL